jgi:hypothetical protein
VTRERRRHVWQDAQAYLEGLIDGAWERASKATRWQEPAGRGAPVSEARVEADAR